MPSNFTALYDACVLYPAPMRDSLMQLALTDLFRARWSNQIHDEWIRSLLKNRPDLTLEQLTCVRNLMNSNIHDSLVTDYEYLIPTLKLPDPDDRHVLAAAIVGHADVIVTFNLSDFPKEILGCHGIDVVSPDDFIADLIDLNQSKVMEAMCICQKRLKNPPKTMDEYLETLLKQGLDHTVSMIKDIYLEDY